MFSHGDGESSAGVLLALLAVVSPRHLGEESIQNDISVSNSFLIQFNIFSTKEAVGLQAMTTLLPQ